MGFLYGHETDTGYQPSWLHEKLKPQQSGNEINGLGEAERRQPTPVYHRRWHKHPWYWVQESFYARQMWDMVQGLIIFKSWRLDHSRLSPVAAKAEQDTATSWSERVKTEALKHPYCDVVGIAKVEPELVFDREWQRGEVTEPWIIVIGHAMDYDELSQNLAKPDGKKRPFWRNKFLPEVREVLSTYLRSQRAAFKLAAWIRARGYAAKGHGGPKGAPINTLHAAIKAGLGELGKHGSIINDKLGSCLRFSYVLTEMPLVEDGPKTFGADDYCMRCQACTRACPPDAISDEKQLVRGVEKWYVDFDKCVPYFNENYGCAICLSICPWSRPGKAPTLIEKLSSRN